MSDENIECTVTSLLTPENVTEGLQLHQLVPFIIRVVEAAGYYDVDVLLYRHFQRLAAEAPSELLALTESELYERLQLDHPSNVSNVWNTEESE